MGGGIRVDRGAGAEIGGIELGGGRRRVVLVYGIGVKVLALVRTGICGKVGVVGVTEWVMRRRIV